MARKLTEEPIFIRRRISHYGAMLKLDLDEENRTNIQRLRAEAELKLEVTTAGDADDFPVVCVGGSAGGLDAYIRLLQHLPADMGVAIVVVNHLRVVATQLHEILPRYTTMPVDLITEGLVLQPNRVFIIPAQRDLHVLDGEFRLKPISKPRGWPDVITVFLRSLTKHWDGKVIAVIVSGYDGDGAAALCGIREVGGITIAQKPETARQPDMPESAIASGCIDFILSPKDIARKIAGISDGLLKGSGRLQTVPARLGE
jgi:chemotaxis response regulator CheB